MVKQDATTYSSGFLGMTLGLCFDNQFNVDFLI
jgi:hypothetical protein